MNKRKRANFLVEIGSFYITLNTNQNKQAVNADCDKMKLESKKLQFSGLLEVLLSHPQNTVYSTVFFMYVVRVL
ncbi:hypothetical protein [Bacillus sp. SA1-12]|uniref:hypothetical protein n=1 Tax=Bacillus sp. SA1-12 TaxID=1455638 RepID=UPI0012E02C9A|nr:hypothetical protein [Bacillus sp. SA1-12]